MVNKCNQKTESTCRTRLDSLRLSANLKKDDPIFIQKEDENQTTLDNVFNDFEITKNSKSMTCSEHIL